MPEFCNELGGGAHRETDRQTAAQDKQQDQERTHPGQLPRRGAPGGEGAQDKDAEMGTAPPSPGTLLRSPLSPEPIRGAGPEPAPSFTEVGEKESSE